MRYPPQRLALTCLLILGLLSACGGADPAPDGETSSVSVADAASDAAPASQGAALGACPLTFDLTETYDPGDLPLGITFQYPEGWTMQDERSTEDGGATVILRRPFEVEGSSLHLALELNKTAQASTREAVEMMTAPASRGGTSMNQEQQEIELGGEALPVGTTVVDGRVIHKTALPGEEGYHLTSLYMWWDTDDRCKEEVLNLGPAILQSFALR